MANLKHLSFTLQLVAIVVERQRSVIIPASIRHTPGKVTRRGIGEANVVCINIVLDGTLQVVAIIKHSF